MSKTVEVIAGHLADRDEPEVSITWVDEAVHLVSALDSAGFVIVPKEPTEEMMDAGREAFLDHAQSEPWPHVGNVYLAMIAASVQEPKP